VEVVPVVPNGALSANVTNPGVFGARQAEGAEASIGSWVVISKSNVLRAPCPCPLGPTTTIKPCDADVVFTRAMLPPRDSEDTPAHVRVQSSKNAMLPEKES
jgi:hypothetical protein